MLQNNIACFQELMICINLLFPTIRRSLFKKSVPETLNTMDKRIIGQ
jgi:hypothetical protein